MTIDRFKCNPIISVGMHPSLGDSINGPSLIRVPAWLPSPLGRYYLYFAHHQGTFIRLAYADRLEGPWSIHVPGTLKLEGSHCIKHIASPDVHVDDERREIRMYYHGPVDAEGQRSKVALSTDGIIFHARPESFGPPYFRVFCWKGIFYALAMPGIFLRSKDGLSNFERGPQLFTPDQRHTAVRLDGNELSVFYSNAFDCPERILLARIELSDDWMNWKASEPETVLQPEFNYEGSQCPLEPSKRGIICVPVHQLRDPCIYRDDAATYLLYSVAGEHGIAIARLSA